MSTGNPKLEVHVRRLTSTGAVNPGELEVYCPHRDASVQVNQCKTCDKFVLCGADPQSGRVFVECRQLTIDSARALRAARRAVLTRRPNIGATLGDRTPVTEIMTRNPLRVRVGVELSAVRTLLADPGTAALAVVNEHEEPVGVILRTTLASASHVAKSAAITTRLTFVLPDTASISQVAALMALEEAGHLAIVAKDGRLTGMVSWIDVLRWFAQADGYVVPERE